MNAHDTDIAGVFTRQVREKSEILNIYLFIQINWKKISQWFEEAERVKISPHS